MTHHRPAGVTFLALVVLTISMVNLYRVAQIIAEWTFLVDLLPFSPGLLVASSTLLGGLGLYFAWSIWAGKIWSYRYLLWISAGYASYVWFNRLFLRSPAGQTNNAFVAGITVVMMLIVIFIFFRRSTKAYFGVVYDNQPEIPKTS
jgi:hypothetical protein